MKDLIYLLTIVEKDRHGIQIKQLIDDKEVAKNTISDAEQGGLVAFFNQEKQEYTTILHGDFFCRVTKDGKDYLITNGSEGVIHRHKESLGLSKLSELASIRSDS